ncbi:hypothetical protein CDAR_448861 [Caerostris darwini]|uniref:Uncharacterized protein n=1 Tax=Caerostris darwini TaxID=1538125 RepID=A0AAV4WEI7_9ARAC|nr:hypothetical protein CDAR_448861 [Caerostris darwini]
MGLTELMELTKFKLTRVLLYKREKNNIMLSLSIWLVFLEDKRPGCNSEGKKVFENIPSGYDTSSADGIGTRLGLGEGTSRLRVVCGSRLPENGESKMF